MKETASLSNNCSVDEEETNQSASLQQKLIEFYHEYEILILFAVVIILAKGYPPLGAEYLLPQITAKWIAVVFIFGTLLCFVAILRLGGHESTVAHS
jgi:sodium/bile acid cotransporter 7